jgi:hypothetical protein
LEGFDGLNKVHNKYHGTAPTNAKYIGRGSPFGNPFVIGKDGNRDEVCNKFESEILPTLDVESLRGFDLVCFCKPQRCHGDSILKKLYGG